MVAVTLYVPAAKFEMSSDVAELDQAKVTVDDEDPVAETVKFTAPVVAPLQTISVFTPLIAN